MSNSTLRFLHTSDLLIGEPCWGLAQPPDTLKSVLANAPFRAAERVFDAAIKEAVDFVICAGNLIVPELAGPRGYCLLAEQFRRLADRRIAVYWATGPSDGGGHWPSSIPLPENVHIFAQGQVEEVSHFRNDQPLATLTGRSDTGGRIRAADFGTNFSSQFNIAVACGEVNPQELGRQRIDYWALGGRYQEATPVDKPRPAHYPGAPQGRSEEHPGTHGCTLVTVDGEGQSHLRRLATDVVRWRYEDVVLRDERNLDEVLARLREEVSALERNDDLLQLIHWRLDGSEPACAVVRAGLRSQQGLLDIQRQIGNDLQWTAAVEVAPPPRPALADDDSTLLGEFLVLAEDYTFSKGENLDLWTQVPADLRPEELRDLLEFNDREERARVLRDATSLGLDILGGRRA